MDLLRCRGEIVEIGSKKEIKGSKCVDMYSKMCAMMKNVNRFDICGTNNAGSDLKLRAKLAAFPILTRQQDGFLFT